EPRIIRTRRNIMDPPDDRIRDLLCRAGFEHVAFMLQWDHDWALVSALIERNPVSGFISGWELHYDERGIEAMCLELLGAIPTERDRQRDKWNAHLTWLHETVCGVLGDYPTPERLLNLDACDRLSWRSAVLAYLYQQMCRGVHFEQRNLGGCASLLLSWAYDRIHACRPQGDFDEPRFLLVERWRGLHMAHDLFAPRVRIWRMVLNDINHHTDRAQSRLALEMAVGGVRPSCQYLLWYYQWAHLTLTGARDPVIPTPGMMPGDVRDGIPEAPDMVQPEDGELPDVHLRVARRCRAPAGRGRGRGQGGADGSPVRVDEPMHIMPLNLILSVPPPVYHPQAYTPNVDQIPDSYAQWCAEMFGQTSYQPVLDHSSSGTPIQQTESFAHMIWIFQYAVIWIFQKSN
ncbi:hypothetical protein PIB30_102425, partial [Stylosanthes scabra]|nr:hypothetical protein [Stylosanthes scabra]